MAVDAVDGRHISSISLRRVCGLDGVSAPKTSTTVSGSHAVVRPRDMEATMTNSTASHDSGGGALWTARVLGTFVILFLLVDGAGKVLRLAPYVEGTAKVGYPAGSLVPLGLVLLACTILYAIRRTAALGAILLTAYLGGAVATHVRMGQPFIIPLIFGVIVWGCLYLRDERIRALLPLLGARAQIDTGE
jgi:hypothetical protein